VWRDGDVNAVGVRLEGIIRRGGMLVVVVAGEVMQ